MDNLGSKEAHFLPQLWSTFFGGKVRPLPYQQPQRAGVLSG
jgi:hypothetical protein